MIHGNFPPLPIPVSKIPVIHKIADESNVTGLRVALQQKATDLLGQDLFPRELLP
jgi:hypothetical protein